MSSHPEYDVVIIGAGPAGSSTALAFKQAAPGLRIALVDKASFPRDKPCGDGLGPGVLTVLEDLGVSEIIAGEQVLSEVEVRGPGNTVVAGALPALDSKAEAGVVMERIRFDERLQAAAIDAGVEDWSGWRFSGSDLERERRLVRVDGAGRTTTLSTALLVGADGASSRVRRDLGVDRNGDLHTGIGIRAYAEVLDSDGVPPSRLLLDFEEELTPGYGWVFPLHHRRANIGAFTLVSDLKKRGSRTTDLLTAFVERLERHGYSVSGVSFERSYLLPLAAGMPKLSHERAALVGDAASMINPWSGEGIYYAMESGRLLARATSSALVGGGSLVGPLRTFERGFRKRFSRHFRGCRVAQIVTRSNAVSERLLRVAARDDTVFRYLTSLMFGEEGIEARVIGRMAVKALWNGGRGFGSNGGGSSEMAEVDE
jgi:geranylgeranyl reductase family protein